MKPALFIIIENSLSLPTVFPMSPCRIIFTLFCHYKTHQSTLLKIDTWFKLNLCLENLIKYSSFRNRWCSSTLCDISIKFVKTRQCYRHLRFFFFGAKQEHADDLRYLLLCGKHKGTHQVVTIRTFMKLKVCPENYFFILDQMKWLSFLIGEILLCFSYVSNGSICL